MHRWSFPKSSRFSTVSAARSAPLLESDEVSRLNSTACTDYIVRVRPNIAPADVHPCGRAGRQHPLLQRAKPRVAQSATREYFRDVMGGKELRDRDIHRQQGVRP